MRAKILIVVFLLAFSIPLQAVDVLVSWNAVTTSATGQPVSGVTYNVYRSTSSSGTGAVKLNTTSITTLSFTDATAAISTTYYYQVSGIASDGTEGNKSVLVRFNASDKIPAAPTGVSVR